MIDFIDTPPLFASWARGPGLVVGFEPLTFFYKVWGPKCRPHHYATCKKGSPIRGAESKLAAACEASSRGRAHTLSISLSQRSSSSSLSAPELQRSTRRRRSKKRIAKSGHNTPPFPSILKLFQLIITCPILNLFIFLNLFMCFLLLLF